MFTSDKRDVNVFARVCLLARLHKSACMDLDEIACRQMSGHGRTGSLLSPIRIIVPLSDTCVTPSALLVVFRF